MNHLKDEYLARISHELRAPLAGLRMWVQVLRSGRPEDRETAIDAIDRCARAQSRLIEDLVDLERGASRELRIAEEILDPRSPLAEAVALARPEADAKAIVLFTAFSADAGLVRGDPCRLQQIAWSLLSCAVELTAPGGRVELTLAAAAGCASIAVGGAGLDEATLGRLLARLNEDESAGLPPEGGVALGLALTRHLVDLHGGTFRVEGHDAGSGARFIVALPQVATPGTAADRLRGVRILLVEDHPSTRQGITRVLSAFGAEVTACASAGSAFEALGRGRHDVILSDITMPEEDGCAFLRRIRGLEGAIGRTPAVALTARARPDEEARALSAGFRRYLAKPVDPQRLVETLVRVLGCGETAPGPAQAGRPSMSGTR